MTVHVFEEQGSWKVRSLQSADVVSASVSAPGPVEVLVRLHRGETEELLDHIYLGTSSPHSWWGPSGLPLLRHLEAGDVIEVRVTGACAFRLDIPGEELA